MTPAIVVLALCVFAAFLVIGEAVIKYLDPEGHWADRVFGR